MNLATCQRSRLGAFALTTAVLLSACDHTTIGGPLDDGPTALPAFSQTITLPDFQQALVTDPVRVEVELVAGQLVAREVEIETADELSDDEKITSKISGISASGGQGTLTLTLNNGFVVAFDPSTEFEGPDGRDFSADEFVAWVEAELADGRQPAVEAKRPAPATPQAPTDATFSATKLEVDDDGDADEIELNIDGDNLEVLAAPPPDARLTLLGIVIDIDTSNGATELEREDDRIRGEQHFKGSVQAVDVAGGSFTLANGDVMRIVDGTRIKHSDDGLASLEAVDAALGQGLGVVAKGKALLEQTTPRTLVAIKVKFQISDDISLDRFRAAVESGAVRVEVELLADRLVAREVEIEEANESMDDEEIESRIDDIAASAGEGTLTLTLNGGFAVAFDRSTEFEGPDDQDFTFDEFVAWVESELAAGRRPGVEAKRPAPGTPQAPSDPTFLAAKLEVDEDVDEDQLKLNIDGDNLEVVGTPPPDARLTMLGLTIDIDVTNGVTELEQDR